MKRDLRRLADAIPAEWNAVTQRVIGCAMEVHSLLGPGLLEKLYEDAMAYELERASLRFARQVELRLPYKDTWLSPQRFDLVVEDLVIVELKAVEVVSDVHLGQLVSYLRASGKPLGLLINFNVRHLRDGVYRRINDRAISLPGDPFPSPPAPEAFVLDPASVHPSRPNRHS